MGIVATWTFENANDLLKALSPIHGVFTGNCSFRGHGSAVWSLLPSAWRELDGKRDRIITYDPDSHRGLIYLEAWMLLSFISRADQQGLRIPGGYNEIKQVLDPFANMDRDCIRERWPPNRGFTMPGFSSAFWDAYSPTGLDRRSLRCFLFCRRRRDNEAVKRNTCHLGLRPFTP